MTGELIYNPTIESKSQLLTTVFVMVYIQLSIILEVGKQNGTQIPVYYVKLAILVDLFFGFITFFPPRKPGSQDLKNK